MSVNEGLEKYRVLDKLDSRNSVFLVRDARDGSLWVKKLIENDSEDVYKRLMSVRQDNIAYIREMYPRDDGAAVIEQYAAGRSISSIIEDGYVFTLSQVRVIVPQLCDAMECLHKNNIVHRDISANNVIVSEEGYVKLIDMGISRIKDPDKTVDTHLMGTAGYAAPEQFGFRQTDERSDIFSLGVLMNVMLTGKLPSEELYCKNYRMKLIISKCTELEPKNRYKNVSQIKRCFKTMPTEKNGAFMSLIRELPGIRTMTPWKMILAGIIYLPMLFIYIFLNGIFISDGLLMDMLVFNIWTVAGIFLPCLVGGDYLYYTERISFLAKLPLPVKVVIRVALSALLAAVVFFFVSILMALFL